uniref:Uncharacterized protein n=1 Tax=Cannabis sativa TaxID=3483 RepID=A0A803PT22_CANSA
MLLLTKKLNALLDKRERKEQRAKKCCNVADQFGEVVGAHNFVYPITLADDKARLIREYAAPMFNEPNPSNGAILSKSYNEAFEILESISSNNYQLSNTRAPTSRKLVGLLEVDALTALTAQMASMNNILKNMSFGGNVQPAVVVQMPRCQGTLPSDTENPRRDSKEHSKALLIKIPLVEALEQLLNYMKFLKDILIKKRRLDEFEMVALIEGCNAMLKSKIPSKLKDLGSFTIPCFIGGTDVGRALCDMRASINLMSVSIFKQLGIGEARSTTVTLQLADRSMGHVEGKIGMCY